MLHVALIPAYGLWVAQPPLPCYPCSSPPPPPRRPCFSHRLYTLATPTHTQALSPRPVPWRGVPCCVCAQVPDLYDPRTQWASYIINAIKAKELFIKDVNYIVKNNEVRHKPPTTTPTTLL